MTNLKTDLDCQTLLEKATEAASTAAFEKRHLDGAYPCGFAWVKIRPARGKLVSYMKKRDIGSKAYGGGYQLWVSCNTQNMDIKYAYAQAFADVLKEAGINAYAECRLD